MILIFTLWIFHLYVATFQQHLQMEYTSLSCNDVRLHQDRLHKLCYPLSCLCYWYVRLVLIAGHCICHRSWLVTMCDIWPVVGVSSIMNATCRTWSYLTSWAFVSNSSFNGAPLAQTLVSNVDYCLPFVLSLLLTFVLRYVGSGYTNVVFQLSLCLLGLKFSLYLVYILYFVVICILIRLLQSKKAHSTTWQDLLVCRYQIISIFPCCNLQNMEYV